MAGQLPEVFGVPAANVLVASLAEALLAVLAKRLEQVVTRILIAAVLYTHHGAVHQAAHAAEHVRRHRRPTADGFGRLQAEAPGEDREAAEQGPLDGIEVLVAPVDGRPQGLVASDGGTAAAGEETKTILQPEFQLTGRHQPDLRGGQLDRQR